MIDNELLNLKFVDGSTSPQPFRNKRKRCILGIVDQPRRGVVLRDLGLVPLSDRNLQEIGRGHDVRAKFAHHVDRATVNARHIRKPTTRAVFHGNLRPGKGSPRPKCRQLPAQACSIVIGPHLPPGIVHRA